MLRGYGQVDASIPLRIVQMAEAEQQARHAYQLAGPKLEQRAQDRITIIAILAILGGFLLAYFVDPWAGMGTVAVGVASPAIAQLARMRTNK
jgi:uncharacterized membrane protein